MTTQSYAILDARRQQERKQQLLEKFRPRRTSLGQRITFNRLRETRLALGLTTEEVAQCLGTSRRQVTLHERTGGCNIRTARAYADLYQRKLDSLWPPEPTR